jgi:hypothetical protein
MLRIATHAGGIVNHDEQDLEGETIGLCRSMLCIAFDGTKIRIHVFQKGDGGRTGDMGIDSRKYKH